MNRNQLLMLNDTVAKKYYCLDHKAKSPAAAICGFNDPVAEDTKTPGTPSVVKAE